MILDILIRRTHMRGKNACWVPGTDYVSIATEAKEVQQLVEEGIKKTDLTCGEFLKHLWEWTDEHGGIILKQLCKPGTSPSRVLFGSPNFVTPCLHRLVYDV